MTSPCIHCDKELVLWETETSLPSVSNEIRLPRERSPTIKSQERKQEQNETSLRAESRLSQEAQSNPNPVGLSTCKEIHFYLIPSVGFSIPQDGSRYFFK